MTTMFRRQLQHARLLRQSRRPRGAPCRLCVAATIVVAIWVCMLVLITPGVLAFLSSLFAR